MIDITEQETWALSVTVLKRIEKPSNTESPCATLDDVPSGDMLLILIRCEQQHSDIKQEQSNVL